MSRNGTGIVSQIYSNKSQETKNSGNKDFWFTKLLNNVTFYIFIRASI